MAQKQGKRRSIAEINVVPYIDVMLVLLIIFMVTAPLLKQGVDVELPQAPANALDNESPEPIVISVDQQGSLYINISEQPDSPVAAEDLLDILKRELQKKSKRPVMVRGDARVPYRDVVETLVMLQQANVGSVGLVTDAVEIDK